MSKFGLTSMLILKYLFCLFKNDRVSITLKGHLNKTG